MMRRIIKFVLLVTSYGLLITVCFAQSDPIRQPAVSGIFYPSDPQALKEMINNFLSSVQSQDIKGQLKGLIVPHAGYKHSGKTAAFAFKLLKDKKFDSIILLGPCHRVYFDGASIYNKGSFQTPLGLAVIDEALAEQIMAFNPDKIKADFTVHTYEHSIEVEIPFLQAVLGEFSFVPVLMRNMSFYNCNMLADAITEAIKGKKVLIIASSDMSHYHDLRTAHAIDEYTLKLIKENNIEELTSALEGEKSELCGSGPVITLMLIMKKLAADKIKILNYSDSGQTSSDHNRVVGYCSVSFSAGADEEDSFLSKEQGKELLQIARKALEAYLRKKKIPQVKIKQPALLEKRGAFVTLKKKGELRGCIGNFEQEPLYLQVQKLAISSATSDPRFVEVGYDELKDIDIEISVLTPMRKINSLDELVIGKHGIYVKKGERSGCFLPQVALETGWTKEEFIRHCFIDKARLPVDAWENGAEVFVFSAQIFSDNPNSISERFEESPKP